MSWVAGVAGGRGGWGWGDERQMAIGGHTRGAVRVLMSWVASIASRRWSGSLGDKSQVAANFSADLTFWILMSWVASVAGVWNGSSRLVGLGAGLSWLRWHVGVDSLSHSDVAHWWVSASWGSWAVASLASWLWLSWLRLRGIHLLGVLWWLSDSGGDLVDARGGRVAAVDTGPSRALVHAGRRRRAVCSVDGRDIVDGGWLSGPSLDCSRWGWAVAGEWVVAQALGVLSSALSVVWWVAGVLDGAAVIVLLLAVGRWLRSGGGWDGARVWDDSRWTATPARSDDNSAGSKSRDGGLARSLSNWTGRDSGVSGHVDGGSGWREDEAASAIDAGASLAVGVRVSRVAIVGREAGGSSPVLRDIDRVGDESQVAVLRNASSAIWVRVSRVASVSRRSRWSWRNQRQLPVG